MSVGIIWFRNDLRLSDNPALAAALDAGPILPVYIWDDESAGDWKFGGAQRWWLHHSLTALDASLRQRGGALILRKGRTVDVLRALAKECGAKRIYANHHYEPWHKAAETDLATEIDLQLHQGNYLVTPDDIRNGQGQRYRMFTPWHRRLSDHLPPLLPTPAPFEIDVPNQLPASDALADWRLLPTTPNWAAGFAGWQPGEAGASAALEAFIDVRDAYHIDRDRPDQIGTSNLSPHLHFGEISPRMIWHAMADSDSNGATIFRTQLAWREHGLNLIDKMPHYADQSGRPSFNHFPWRSGAEADADFAAWTKGQTGYPIVDAGMRQLWQTGWMHNRVRMVTASFLVKHLLLDWRRGEQWFWDTLVDADLGANAMNWQYVAGTGVDAPVFSRIMSPKLQFERFEMADYIRQYVPELAHLSDRQIANAHEGGPAVKHYPQPLISHPIARARALDAWASAKGAVHDRVQRPNRSLSNNIKS